MNELAREKERIEREWRESSDDAGITMAKYNAIRVGMIYREVEDVMGRAFNNVGGTEFGGQPAVIKIWNTNFGAFAAVTFQGDKVVSKAQSGLR